MLPSNTRTTSKPPRDPTLQRIPPTALGRVALARDGPPDRVLLRPVDGLLVRLVHPAYHRLATSGLTATTTIIRASSSLAQDAIGFARLGLRVSRAVPTAAAAATAVLVEVVWYGFPVWVVGFLGLVELDGGGGEARGGGGGEGEAARDGEEAKAGWPEGWLGCKKRHG